MNSLKRIIVSIKSQIDHVADDFENHEALAETALQDLQAVASKTRLHLHKMQKMSAHYSEQLEYQQQQANLWSERAIKIRADDEEKALACVRRLRQTQQHIDSLEKQRQNSKAQEQQIADDLNNIQEQLHTLKNKKEILAARQNRAGVREILDEQGNPMTDVNNIFERWEGSVVSSEFEIPEVRVTDSLASEFEKQEDEMALTMMLDALCDKPKPKKQNKAGEDNV